MHGNFRGAALIVLLSHCEIAAALEPTVKVDVETPLRPVVNGQTNLPDSTELIISVRCKESDYFGQDKVTVAGGKFRTQEFSEHDTDLSPGKYSVEVFMPIQFSESVRSIIGDDGEKLTGPLVKHEELTPGIGIFSNFVEYVSTFQVTGRR